MYSRGGGGGTSVLSSYGSCDFTNEMVIDLLILFCASVNMMYLLMILFCASVNMMYLLMILFCASVNMVYVFIAKCESI